MSVDGLFSRSFWGEKNMGFESLNQNMKTGFKNTSEFCDFLRDINTVEENYAKALSKLSKQAASYSNAGSFKLWWSMFSTYLEKVASLRSSLESERLTLWRDVQKYLEELQKKHRILKENETGTQEVVHSFQVANTHLQKAKELYHARYKEYERVRLNDAHSTKDMEKAETKLKKAQDEYKYSVEKYNNLRLQFVDKMHVSCGHFEEMEYTHLLRVCEFFSRFVEALVRSHSAHLSLATEFNQRRNLDLNANNLLLNMVEERGTGQKEPPPAEFEDVEVAAAFLDANNDPPPGVAASQSSTPCSSHLTSGSNGLRAASALPALGSQESPMTNHQIPLDPSWQSSLNEISTTHSSGLGRRAGNLFQRRNRQNSTGLEGDATSVNSSGSTPGSFAQRLANVRNLARLPRKISNSPCDLTSKAAVASTSDCPKVDDEGYNIRPANPWATERSRSASSSSNGSGHSGTSSSPSEKTFKGIKVNIRPPGDFSPGVLEVALPPPPNSTPQHATSPISCGSNSLKARDSRRPHTSADNPFKTICASNSVMVSAIKDSEVRSNSVTTVPLVPLLPPPPGQDTISNRKGTRAPLQRTLEAPSRMAPSTAKQMVAGEEEPFNPFGLPQRDERTPTPQWAGGQEAVFTQLDDSNRTYGRLIDLRDDIDEAAEKATLKLRSQESSNEAKDLDEVSLYSVCHAPLAALDDEETSPLPSSPPPTLSIPWFSTELRALPPPVPPLPIAIALTETWRAQFPNGGGSSFTTTERPAQSLFGQVTLAVAREDLRLLTFSRKASLKPLVLIFSRAQRMRSVKATFSGVSVTQSEGKGDNGKAHQYRVSIPGDLLYHYLVGERSSQGGYSTTANKKEAEAEEQYTRLSLLDYTVDATGLPPPITMCTFWRCEPTTTDFRLDFFVQWPKWPANSASSLGEDDNAAEISCQDLRVNLIVDGGVVRMQSRPLGTWNAEQMRASWSIPLNLVNPIGQQPQHPGVDVSGNIRAKFFLTNGPGTPQPVALQYCRDGGCLPSGAVLSLGTESLSSSDGGGGYRLTMCKYRLLGDRYFCDPPVPVAGMTQSLLPLSPSITRAQSSI